ncbi:MAG: respiratory nitrate reductase subunit gamma [Desulfobacterales bacterium]|nr:MAG: respiratory nitrate reductase subunit gamma [Desulfobacterales bacterium]
MSLWKNVLKAAIPVLALLWLPAAAEAGWLIDRERFHISVHGRLSCGECHSDIDAQRRHPDPADVDRTLEDFFHSEQCTACHDDAADEIAEGRHGDQHATPWQNFENCIECHDPHYELREASDAAGADLSLPAKVKCSLCHELESQLPDFSEEDQPCLQCHLAVSGDDSRGARQIALLCFHCHDAEKPQSGSFALIDPASYASTPHTAVNCLVCHPQAAAFGHDDQVSGDCSRCHRPHDEKTAHDLHAIVSCEACHLNGVEPLKDSASGHIVWQRPRPPDRISPIHQMQIPEKDVSCRSCHTGGNAIGAPAMVLPPKSIICMPCHAATLSVGDTITVFSLALFLAGMMVIGSVWFSGGDPSLGTRHRLTRAVGNFVGALFSRRIFIVAKSLILDGLLQRRLFRVSKERWLLHAFIFYPFLLRFIWGLWALAASLQWPQWSPTWAMLDKNHPLTAFLFDLSGMLVIVGVTGMALRRGQQRSQAAFSDLPAADWPAYSLLGGIMIVGFVLEGMRMAMTNSPDGAAYAFVGDAVSRMLAGVELTGIYGYVWYLHAILTGAFIVYLPFSRMLHMIMAPVVLAMNAATEALEGYKAGRL